MGIFSKRQIQGLITDEDRAARETYVARQQSELNAKRTVVEGSDKVSRLIRAIIAQAKQEYVARGSVRHIIYQLTGSQRLLFEEDVVAQYVLQRIEAEIPGLESVQYLPRQRAGIPGLSRRPLRIIEPRLSVVFKKPLR